MNNIDFDTVAVKMEGITKRFGDFVANDNIGLTVHKGEIHALLGENGAGKSTLMNILYGLLQPNEGSISIFGEKVEITEPNVAIKHGIGMVHQHFMLIPPFTVTENIILGMEPVKGLGVINKKKARQDVIDLSERYGLNVDPDAMIKDLSVGMQQRVEIIKALYRGAEIFILDEPTAVLTPQEIHELIHIMNSLTEQGKTIIIITHKLAEIKQSSDFCTIIRRGKYIDTVDVSQTNETELASKMVGREVLFSVDRGEYKPGDVALSVEGLWAKGRQNLDAVKDVNFDVRTGEILGLVGIDGNGQTELAEVLTGLRKAEKGSVKVNGKDIVNQTPRQIIKSRVGSIPEDRQQRGLVLEYNTAENMILSKYMDKPFSNRGLLNDNEIIANAKKLIDRFDVRPTDPQHKAGELSGGNQQKVIIAREVSNEPDVLIAAQPTRGLDVGAIEFVHKSLVEQRDNGKAILLVSLELDEVLNLSDRIAVIYDGRIVGELDPQQTDENEIGLLMAGGKAHAE